MKLLTGATFSAVLVPASALAFFASTLASLASARPAAAQEDFRAADVDRPIKVEDAIPIKFREWEIEFGARGAIGEGSRGLVAIGEIKTGLFRNGQFGLELEGGFANEGAGSTTAGGLEAATAHLFYGLTRETPSLPALAFRLEGSTPGAGDLRHEDWRLGAKAIATRSLGRTRLHLNGGYTFASMADGDDYWRAGVGLDVPIGLFSRALLADVYAEIPVSNGRTRVWTELGMRLQISNWSVLDLGIATRLDEWETGNANLELVLGWSRVFGFAGSRVGAYPDPTIP